MSSTMAKGAVLALISAAGSLAQASEVPARDRYEAGQKQGQIGLYVGIVAAPVAIAQFAFAFQAIEFDDDFNQTGTNIGRQESALQVGWGVSGLNVGGALLTATGTLKAQKALSELDGPAPKSTMGTLSLATGIVAAGGLVASNALLWVGWREDGVGNGTNNQTSQTLFIAGIVGNVASLTMTASFIFGQWQWYQNRNTAGVLRRKIRPTLDEPRTIRPTSERRSRKVRVRVLPAIGPGHTGMALSARW